ncbi:hypothetical protein Pr1d_23210 [Bythopirellula goksoeyrii]|uniref:Uncharacterized protein n=1 Tax=Bythopirellula goksoeyrii TaxID=1400387 RepID=A0A5B9QLL6_9BACT|nr:hypothetical protein Pr1d_23210 [Bythopirellula goksoeyrii]
MIFFVVAVVAGGAYLYTRMDSEIRFHVQELLSSQFPHLNVSVGAARLVENQGIAIHNLVISETSSNQLQSNLLVVDEMLLECDVELSQLVRGAPQIRRILVRHPELWASRELDGSWNLESLWPPPSCGNKPPQIVIEDARLTLVDQMHPTAAPLSLRDVDLNIQAETVAPTSTLPSVANPSPEPMACLGRFEIKGTLGGPLVRQAEFEAKCDFRQQKLELSGSLVDLKLTKELLSWSGVILGPKAEEVQLQGSVTGNFSVEHELTGKALPKVSAKLALSDGRLEHHQLSRPLTDLSCEIRVHGETTFVDGLRCNCGSAGVALQLERKGWQITAPLSMALRAENVSLDKALLKSLPAQLQAEWHKYKPTGTVDADLQLTFDGVNWRPTVTLTGRNLSFESDKFAYRVSDGSGTLNYVPSGVTQPAILNIDLVGYGGGQPLKFTGQVFDPQPGALGWLEIVGENVEIEDRMVNALPGKTKDVIQSMHPEGRFNVRWRIDRTLPGQLKPYSSLNLELVSCRVNYDKFPYPLSGIRGVIQAEDNRWTFSNLVSGGSRNVQCQGTLNPSDAGNELSLQFIGKEIPFDDDLLRALPPQVQKAWKEMRPRGRVDLVAEIFHETGLAKPSIRVAVQPRPDSASIQPEFFPYLMDGVAGTITYQDGKVLLNEIRAQHGRTTLRTNGSGEFREDGSWHMQLEGMTADRLMPRRDLIVALPPRLQKLAEQIRIEGNNFGISNAVVSFSKSADPNAVVASQWDMQLDCTEASMQAGIDLQNIHGSVRLRGFCDGKNCEESGELDLDSVVYQNVQFVDVQGPLWIDDVNCLVGRWACEKQGLPVRHLTARVYDGRLAADGWVTFEDLPKYGVEATLTDAILMRMMVERFRGQQAFNGKVAASFNLRGSGRSRLSLVGDGDVQITEANIYELPLLVGMLKVLRHGTPDTTAFNQSQLKFRIDGPHIYLDQFDFLGDAVSLYGQGTTNFDQQLNLVFHGVVGRNDLRLPFVKNFLDRAGQSMMKMYVDGTMSNPQIHTQPLPGINQLIQQIQDDLDTTTGTSTLRQAGRIEPPK